MWRPCTWVFVTTFIHSLSRLTVLRVSASLISNKHLAPHVKSVGAACGLKWSPGSRASDEFRSTIRTASQWGVGWSGICGPSLAPRRPFVTVHLYFRRFEKQQRLMKQNRIQEKTQRLLFQCLQKQEEHRVSLCGFNTDSSTRHETTTVHEFYSS